jgi:UDP-glucose:(heptosyl)LPS alpha-1,3-glucosyltransferase
MGSEKLPPLETHVQKSVRKRVCFATGIPVFSRQRGGAERYVVDLCTRMAHEGYDVHVYTEEWAEEDSRISFHRIKTIPFPRSFRLLSFALRATREIEAGAYPVTFGVGNTLKATVLQPHGGVHWAWFWRSLRAYRNPMFRTVKLLGRIFSPKQWVSGWIENAPYRSNPLPRIVAISDMVKQDMMRWYRIPSERIAVIYNGVDVERFHPRNRQFRPEVRRRHGVGEELLILFVSNNFRMKGLGYLLQALALLKQEDSPAVKLLILGRDHSAPYLRIAGKLGVSDEVIFAGSTKEPEKYYGAADLLVHPTFYDACSLTVLEALASGLPVITSLSNGASGLVRHGEEGWLLEDPGDVDGLRKGIQRFFDEEFRQKAGDLARKKAEAHSEKANFDQMIRIFGEAVIPPGEKKQPGGGASLSTR